MKRLMLTLILMAAVAVSASAAGKPVKGKITAIEGTRVTIALEGDRADWIKKGGAVQFKAGPGKIVELSAPSAKPVTIVVSTKKASEMKVGETITFEKGLATSGC